MQVTVSARHGHLDDQTQAALRDKAEGLLKYFERLVSVAVVVDLHQTHAHQVKVEITAVAGQKHEFVATEANGDVIAAFNLAQDKIKQQIKHYKERLQDHRRDPSHNEVGGK